MNNLLDKISTSFQGHGMKIRTVKIGHISEVKDEILGRHSSGMFNEEFFQQNFNWLPTYPKYTLKAPRTAIVAAMPQSMTKCYFDHNGKTHEVIIPPTYISRDAVQTAEELLKRELSPSGFSLERVTAPLKLLAARSGLGQYGRNNICYVSGMGSFTRLAAFYTDWECDVDNWQEPAVMASCEHCTACLNSCSSGAISSDRFLLHGEYCITHLNEFSGDFPKWVDKSWHNSLVGCMSCQLCCPANKAVISTEEGLHFNEDETELLLGGIPEQELSGDLKLKLDKLCITDYYDVLPRNLRVLVE